MATKQQRTMVTLSEDTKKTINALAKKQKKSISKTTAELLDFALSVHEDVYFNKEANRRISEKFKKISHQDMWD
ncbi:hypothetical protein CSB11_00555 [Candidatus Campbellbacteria bacterium]|nr:MAG: hypothetical protein CSB11_00555 [Candidatus Campbellbacteria bacterium]